MFHVKIGRILVENKKIGASCRNDAPVIIFRPAPLRRLLLPFAEPFVASSVSI